MLLLSISGCDNSTPAPPPAPAAQAPREPRALDKFRLTWTKPSFSTTTECSIGNGTGEDLRSVDVTITGYVANSDQVLDEKRHWETWDTGETKEVDFSTSSGLQKVTLQGTAMSGLESVQIDCQVSFSTNN